MCEVGACRVIVSGLWGRIFLYICVCEVGACRVIVSDEVHIRLGQRPLLLATGLSGLWGRIFLYICVCEVGACRVRRKYKIKLIRLMIVQ